MASAGTKRVLVAPLNWGLGHASRCIPLIRKLLERSVDVVLAADGRPHEFLRNEFPGLELHRLPDIAIRYDAASSMLASMVRQLPDIVSTYVHERRHIERIVKEWRIGGIISDNRFGLFTRSVPCVYMTHQIMIMAPPAFARFEPLLRRMHARIIERYDECWIPDCAGDVNLSGALSHGAPLPKNAVYIGPLSRFTRAAPAAPAYDVAVVLSGPEPQRTIFEELLRTQLRGTALRACIVQGIPEGRDVHQNGDTVEIVSSMNADALYSLLASSNVVISRSGYSSIMDIATLGARAVFVPTPGQTEQEYLASRLREMHMYYSEDQGTFDLRRALEQSRAFSGSTLDMPRTDLLDRRIDHFLTMITT